MAAKDIHKEMLPMYGESCLSRQAVHNLVQKFLEGLTSVEDEHRVGRPVCAWFRQQPQEFYGTRFPWTCEMVGQVFKFVWILR